MPKLVIFVACEKVIVDQATNAVSLMSLLQDLNVQIPPGTVVPPNSAIPMNWTVLSVWQRRQQDQGKRFEQQSQLVNLNGQLKMETPVAEFQMTGDFHRIISQVAGFPVDTNGTHLVKCLFRERGAADWTEVASYPINLKWVAGNPVVH